MSDLVFVHTMACATVSTCRDSDGLKWNVTQVSQKIKVCPYLACESLARSSHKKLLRETNVDSHELGTRAGLSLFCSHKSFFASFIASEQDPEPKVLISHYFFSFQWIVLFKNFFKLGGLVKSPYLIQYSCTVDTIFRARQNYVSQSCSHFFDAILKSL